MVYKKEIDYTIAEIKKRKGTPYHMANENLANELYPYIKNEFENVKMIKCGIEQWFVVTESAKKKLIKQLEQHIVTERKMLIELQSAINRLN